MEIFDIFDILIKLYFKTNINIKPLNEFVIDLCNEIIHKNFQRISYVFEEEDKLKQSDTLISIKKLENLYTLMDKFHNVNYELYTLDDNYEYKSTDTNISFNYFSKNNYYIYNSILLQINASTINNKISNLNFQLLYTSLINYCNYSGG